MSAIGAPDYLQALEHELADLAPDERADLLEEVEASLLELDDDPVARLGPPAQFAAELRESAGLPPVAPPVEPEIRRAAGESGCGPAPRRPPRSRASSRRSGGACARSSRWPRSPTSSRRRIRSRSRRTTARWCWASPCSRSRFAGSVWIGLAGRRRRLPARGVRIALDLVLLVLAFPVGAVLLDQNRWVSAPQVQLTASSAAPRGVDLPLVSSRTPASL